MAEKDAGIMGKDMTDMAAVFPAVAQSFGLFKHNAKKANNAQEQAQPEEPLVTRAKSLNIRTKPKQHATEYKSWHKVQKVGWGYK